MINAISTSYLFQYQSTTKFSRQTTAQAEKNSSANFAAGADVEISDAGRNALTEAQNSTANVDTNAAVTDESKLSDKAKGLLDSLRQKYGDYDFVVSSNPDAAQTVGSDKEYSVIFTPEELEQMAEDDDYAQKVMGQVGNAVDMLKNISEKDLGEGVQFSQLSVSIDSDGNMTLFAQLEKLSADQKERLDAAREKRAEEKADADKKAQADDETKTDETKADDESNGLTKILFKSADVEAADEEELLAKIFGIDWDNIAEEEAFI